MKRLLTAILCFLAVACGPAATAAVIVNALPVPMEIRDEFFGHIDSVDIDGNGTVDFSFGSSVSGVALRTEGSNRSIIRLAGAPNIGGRLTPLDPGYSIFSPLILGELNDLEWASSDYLGGYVSPGENAFQSIVFVASTGSASDFNGRGPIGIEFSAADGIHYGYLDIDAGAGYAGITLYGWAYESQPNTPIFAGSVPEPERQSLLMLALAGWLLRRRRDGDFS